MRGVRTCRTNTGYRSSCRTKEVQQTHTTTLFIEIFIRFRASNNTHETICFTTWTSVHFESMNLPLHFYACMCVVVGLSQLLEWHRRMLRDVSWVHHNPPTGVQIGVSIQHTFARRLFHPAVDTFGLFGTLGQSTAKPTQMQM